MTPRTRDGQVRWHLRRVLIAARGVVAVRVIRACRDLGFATVAVYDDADVWAPHAGLADEAYALAGAGYADIETLIAIALRAEADAVHPGDGPLALDADAADAVRDRGLTWIGAPARPPAVPDAVPEERAQVDLLAGTTGVVSLGARITAASRRCLPVRTHTAPRETRAELAGRARSVAGDLGLRGYGVAEFGRAVGGDWRFLGMSTRLTSEHAVAEEQSGVDIVAAQLALAFDERTPLPRAVKDSWACGVAIEAEDRARGALRAAGTVRSFGLPAGPGVRVDAALREGQVIVPTRDNRLAFITVSARTEDEARQRLGRATAELSITGVTTTTWLANTPSTPDPTFTDTPPDTGIVPVETRGGPQIRLALQ
jgi:acetyl/propionyl-CoA carboxylase alpha subunit